MKLNRIIYLLVVCGILCMAVSTRAGQYTGLWVGTVTLTGVSEASRRVADLSFDLGLTAVKTEDVLLGRRSTWRYNATGAAISFGSYTSSTIPTTNWSSGAAPLGYGGTQATTIPFGQYSSNKNPTTYFSREFPASGVSGYSRLNLRVWRDDGIIVYLNGAEVLRNNLSTGAVGSSARALAEISGSPDSTQPDLVASLPVTSLREGTNRLDVEVHNAGPRDSDLFFDLELAAELVTPQQVEKIPLEAGGWNYSDTGTAPPGNWKTTNPSGWQSGPAPLGFNKTGIKTPVNNRAAVYFFKTFTGGDIAGFNQLNLALLRDDGAVVYLNGNEIMRSNMPPGTIDMNTTPIELAGTSQGDRYVVATVPLQAGDLIAGENAVAVEVHQHPSELTSSTAPATGITRTPATLPLRLLIHVDAGGAVRLLKEAILMQDASAVPVVLTSTAKVAQYQGSTVRGGTRVGVRLSSVGYDFTGSNIPCTGAVNTPGTGRVNCTALLPYNHPTNPFLHRYHPDHDNLDERYESEVREAYDVKRQITIQFDARYPANPDDPVRSAPPGWGDSLLGGIYGEIIDGLNRDPEVGNGLNRDPLSVSGWFSLQRVSTAATVVE